MILTADEVNNLCKTKNFTPIIKESEAVSLQPGTVVDRFKIIADLKKKGSFGSVFLVEDMDSKKKYAMKFTHFHSLNLNKTHFEYYLAKFVCIEFKVGRQAHKNIGHTYYLGLYKGNPYIIMEFYKNGSVRDYINKFRGNAPAAELDKILRGVLYGLQHIHRRGIVHRDLKPDNILLDSVMTPVLIDFGIAGDRNLRLTLTVKAMGSYPYIAPEILQEQNKGDNWLDIVALPSVDIFSFGVTAYELFTKRLPFGSLSAPADLPIYVANAIKGKYVDITRFRADTPPIWREVIHRSLHHDPEKRFKKIEEILDVLDNKVGHVSISSRPKITTDLDKLVLKVVEGEDLGRLYDLHELVTRLKRNYLTIGRETKNVKNDIPIKEETSIHYVSRKHATLILEGKNWYIRDGQFLTDQNGNIITDSMNRVQWKSSTNGTYVNSDKVIGKHIILPGDIITIGDIKLMVLHKQEVSKEDLERQNEFDYTKANEGATLISNYGGNKKKKGGLSYWLSQIFK